MIIISNLFWEMRTYKDFKIKKHYVVWYFSYASAISVVYASSRNVAQWSKREVTLIRKGPVVNLKNVNQRKLSFVDF